MASPNYPLLMAHYNRWMNEKLYALCADLSDATRRKDMGAYFKSIHSTFNHILYGDLMWIGRFDGSPFSGARVGQDLHADFAALQAHRVATDQRILDWATKVESDWLAAPFTFTSGIDGKTRTFPAWVLVTQMFNHQTHHRGQITTLLMQLGIDPGVTDVPWIPTLSDFT